MTDQIQGDGGRTPDPPKYGERTPEPARHRGRPRPGIAAWTFMFVLLGAVLLIIAPFVIALWRWALGL